MLSDLPEVRKISAHPRQLGVVRMPEQNWWEQILRPDHMENIGLSGKLMFLFSTLEECEKRQESLIVFSQSTLTLDMIEHFLSLVTMNTKIQNPDVKLGNFTGTWQRNIDYFRFDGQTNQNDRNNICAIFERSQIEGERDDNPRAR